MKVNFHLIMNSKGITDMFMLITTHEKILKEQQVLCNKYKEIAGNKEQQIVLYKEQVVILKEQLRLKDILLSKSKPLTESTIFTKPSKFNSTEKAPYLNHSSDTGSDNVLPLAISSTALYVPEESDQPIKTTVDTSSNEIASAASSSSHYDIYSSPSSSYDSYSSSHSSSCDSSSSSSSSD